MHFHENNSNTSVYFDLCLVWWVGLVIACIQAKAPSKDAKAPEAQVENHRHLFGMVVGDPQLRNLSKGHFESPGQDHFLLKLRIPSRFFFANMSIIGKVLLAAAPESES